MLGNLIFWSGLAVSLAIGLVYFRDLGDVSQMLIRVKRENMLRFIRNEYRLIAVGLAAFALATVVHFAFGTGPRWSWWVAIVLCVVLYGFPYLWVHVGLRNQKDSARFYSIDEAKDYVGPSNPVIVMENNGVARAYPQAQLLRPHLAGNEEGLGGENVVMTYCAMANLGIGYTPEVEGEKLELDVLAQHGNNLVLQRQQNRRAYPADLRVSRGGRRAEGRRRRGSLPAAALAGHETLAHFPDDLPWLSRRRIQQAPFF